MTLASRPCWKSMLMVWGIRVLRPNVLTVKGAGGMPRLERACVREAGSRHFAGLSRVGRTICRTFPASMPESAGTYRPKVQHWARSRFRGSDQARHRSVAAAEMATTTTSRNAYPRMLGSFSSLVGKNPWKPILSTPIAEPRWEGSALLLTPGPRTQSAPLRQGPARSPGRQQRPRPARRE